MFKVKNKNHTQLYVAIYEKHSHIQQNVVVIYHFLLDVSFLIEDHYHDPKVNENFHFKH